MRKISTQDELWMTFTYVKPYPYERLILRGSKDLIIMVHVKIINFTNICFSLTRCNAKRKTLENCLYSFKK